jgi:hypothetical protein
MSRRKKYEEDYEDEEEEVEEEEEAEEERQTRIQQMIDICETRMMDILQNDPDNEAEFSKWQKRSYELKKSRSLECQQEESDAAKRRDEVLVAEAKSDKIFKISQLIATVATPITTEIIRSVGANKQVNTVVDYEREGNIFKTGASPFMKKL